MGGMVESQWYKVDLMENEFQEEFRKIEKMNSQERLVYLRDMATFYKTVVRVTGDPLDHILERILLVTKGYDGDGQPALV